MARTTLCPACSTCPEVVVDGETVRVGESITVQKAEWNVLIDAIKSGKVGKV